MRIDEPVGDDNDGKDDHYRRRVEPLSNDFSADCHEMPRMWVCRRPTYASRRYDGFSMPRSYRLRRPAQH